MTDLVESLDEYLRTARWFGGKGRGGRVTGVRRLALLGSDPAVGIELVSLSYPDGDEELYQVPLAYYTEAQAHLTHALVGEVEDAGRRVMAYDAMHDRLATQHWLRAFAEGAEVGALRFRRTGDHELDLSTHSTLFSGEQSNSSVAFGEDALMKVFRKVTPGRNPDIEIHRALTDAGSEHVAALYGWLETEPSAVGEEGDETLQLAMLQQFLRTASDGWELALVSVRNLYGEADLHADEVGGDFAGESERLGVAIAEVHEALRAEFPTGTLDADGLRSLADDMDARLDATLKDVPDLEVHAAGLRSLFRAVGDLEGPVPVQRVHADLHLGQTLRTVRGWKIVDFEGEPAKPLSDRVLPDSPWRDVAGMLRSFGYAAHAGAADVEWDPDQLDQISYRAREWSDRNRSAFLSGYTAGRGTAPQEGLLLQAYEADKAVYEALYEARNRPSWLHIPLRAIHDLVTGGDA